MSDNINLSAADVAHIHSTRDGARVSRKAHNRARYHRQYQRRAPEKLVRVAEIVVVHVGPLIVGTWLRNHGIEFTVRSPAAHDSSEFFDA